MQALSFHYWRSGMFSDCIKKLSRKGFGLGTWDELDKWPSRLDFWFSRKKKKRFFGSFLSDHFLVFNFCPRDGDEWLGRGWERFLSNSRHLQGLCETALETSSPEIPRVLSVLQGMTFTTSRECFEEQQREAMWSTSPRFHTALKNRLRAIMLV